MHSIFPGIPNGCSVLSISTLKYGMSGSLDVLLRLNILSCKNLSPGKVNSTRGAHKETYRAVFKYIHYNFLLQEQYRNKSKMPKGYNLSQGHETSMKDKSVGEKGNFKQHQTVDSYNTVGVAEFIRRKIEVVVVMITRVTTGYMKKKRENISLAVQCVVRH